MAALDIERDETIAHLLDEMRRPGSTIQAAETLREVHPDLAEELLRLSAIEQALHLAVNDWKEAAGDETRSSAAVGVAPETEGEAKPLPAGTTIPERIGRYRIVRFLGKGGMGTVFEAEDPQLQRRVAIKVPHFAGSAEKQELSRRRFLREARSAAAIEHPNVCPIHDVGEHEGQPFVVMAFVEGESLADRLHSRTPLDGRAAAALTVKIAAGLGAVHAHGIVHRDLKPANILLRGKDGEPILTDFGLAQFALEDENLTADGIILGTPAYMAPEQADPALGAVSSQSDVYSLGVILFEMVTGRRPFEGSTMQIISQVGSKTAPRAAEFRRDLAPALDGIIAKATARDRQNRFARAEDVAKVLSDWLSLGATTETTAAYRPAAAASRNQRRWVMALAGLAAVAMLLLVGRELLRDQKPGAKVGPPDPGTAAYNPEASSGGVPVTGAGATPEGVLPKVENKPLRGAIDVKVWRKDRTDQPAMLLHHRGALPLAPGDWIRIEVELNRPAYVYIVWIDTEGKATPIYPWRDGWERHPPAVGAVVGVGVAAFEKRIAKLSLPETATGIAPLDPGPAGIETLLLLAREVPLPADVELAKLFAGLPRQKAFDLHAAAWFENGDLVRNEADRGPIRLDKAKESDDPVLRTQALLRTRLKAWFPYTRGVSFANRGD